MSDDEAINYLIKLKMIGPWTAMMLLCFVFNRPNIWPTYNKKTPLDIGLLRAISINYKKNICLQSFLQKTSKNFRHIAQWQPGIFGEVLILITFQYNTNHLHTL